jgi:hypothetical protein
MSIFEDEAASIRGLFSEQAADWLLWQRNQYLEIPSFPQVPNYVSEYIAFSDWTDAEPRDIRPDEIPVHEWFADSLQSYQERQSHIGHFLQELPFHQENTLYLDKAMLCWSFWDQYCRIESGEDALYLEPHYVKMFLMMFCPAGQWNTWRRAMQFFLHHVQYNLPDNLLLQAWDSTYLESVPKTDPRLEDQKQAIADIKILRDEALRSLHGKISARKLSQLTLRNVESDLPDWSTPEFQAYLQRCNWRNLDSPVFELSHVQISKIMRGPQEKVKDPIWEEIVAQRRARKEKSK